jgi:hypothetical protein
MPLATAAFGLACCGLPSRVAARDEFKPPVRSSCTAQRRRANFLWPCRDSVSIHPGALGAARIAVRDDPRGPVVRLFRDFRIAQPTLDCPQTRPSGSVIIVPPWPSLDSLKLPAEYWPSNVTLAVCVPSVTVSCNSSSLQYAAGQFTER